VQVTAEAAAKTAGTDANSSLETVFSACVLPVDFFRDLIRGNAATGLHLVEIAL
jgi:hypothetical protein